ncbi:hypothetical protein [Streptomyces sp. NPDC014764]|uniref:hypothetical protein n=1 Tax=Streptomyces sp. NPDC014764 TaxID=3364907 RepID=UPI0036FD557F
MSDAPEQGKIDQESGPSEGDDSETKPKRTRRNAAINRPYPRRTLEEALRIPQALKEYNGGNAWPPEQVAKALGVGRGSSNFFYLTASSRDFGLTSGTRDSPQITLTTLGRQAVYPSSHEDERESLYKAFFSVEIFHRVVDHFNGSKLPEERFLTNTLQTSFGLPVEIHGEFLDLFEKNCRFVGIGSDFEIGERGSGQTLQATLEASASTAPSAAAPPIGGTENPPTCFVIMPFSERDESHAVGFFDEVFEALFKPAVTNAGFEITTARRQGSDIIHSTIVTELLDADLVLADLTEHNPNVLFELGMRMAEDKPVVLVRAKGTGPIFDVDNMLRVEEYNPNLWTSTVAKDIPKIEAHVIAAWENRDTAQTFLKILRQAAK